MNHYIRMQNVELRYILLPAILFCLMISTYAQTNTLAIGSAIRLPKDTTEGKQLIASLNNFLRAKEKPNIENTGVFGKDVLKTYVLLDEMNGIEKSEKYKDNNFYKPHLTNLIELDDNTWMIQLSYVGIAERNPLLRASFKLIAHKSASGFLFSSPLEQNTAHWSTQKIGYCTFHTKQAVDMAKLAACEKTVAVYDKKLKVNQAQFEAYICDNLSDALNAIGVEYKSDYNGRLNSRLSSQTENHLLIIDGLSYDNGVYDPHDTWHDRLHNVVSTAIINKPVDEGCAYLYAGSWMISWKDIFRKFKAKVCANRQINWLDEYEKFQNFGDSQEKHLLVAYVINALLVQKIEKEKGFLALMDLLRCGKYQKGNENYYAALEKITGITKSSFNENVWELINNER